jgi:hypothetical protein
VKDIKIGYSTFIAGGEEVDTKPAFRFSQRGFVPPTIFPMCARIP